MTIIQEDDVEEVLSLIQDKLDKERDVSDIPTAYNTIERKKLKECESILQECGDEREIVYSPQYYRQYTNGDRESVDGGTVETNLETQINKVKSTLENHPEQGAEILKEVRTDQGIFPPDGAGNPVVVCDFEPDKILDRE